MKSRRIQQFHSRLRKGQGAAQRQTTRDLSLARRLSRTIEHDLALAEIQGIHVYVRDGVVTLHGTVRHDLDRELLEALVRQAAHVEDVVSHLDVVDR